MLNILGIKIGRYILYELSGTPKSINPIVDDNVIRITDFEEIKFNTLGILPETMDTLLQHDSDLFVYIENGKTLGMMWGHRGSCYVRGPGISLFQDMDSVYWFWIFTLQEARGKQVYKKLKDAFFKYYVASKTFTALVEPNNCVMRNEMNKIGFKVKKCLFYVKCFSLSFVLERSYLTHKFKFNIERLNRQNLDII